MNTTEKTQTRGQLQEKLGLSIASRLSDASDNLPSDISERLKAARMLAIGKRRVIKRQLVSAISGSGASAVLRIGGDTRSPWNVIASLIPLLALIAGFLAISAIQDQDRASEIADVDTELLSDDLPPSAYTDPGFAHFLSVNRRD
jgi:hypothetical protein